MGRLGFVCGDGEGCGEAWKFGVELYWLESSRFEEMLGSKVAFSQAPGARCAHLFRVKSLAACFSLRGTYSKQKRPTTALEAPFARRFQIIMANSLASCVSSLRSSNALLSSSISILDSGVNDFPRLAKVLQTTRVCLPVPFLSINVLLLQSAREFLYLQRLVALVRPIVKC